MNCQENCPYLMPCGNCTDCTAYPNCSDKPSNTVCEECKECFNNKEEKM